MTQTGSSGIDAAGIAPRADQVAGYGAAYEPGDAAACGAEYQDWLLADILNPPDGGKPLPSWLQRIDRWGTRWGDTVNPILVKETRQALKSRQFVATFSLLLFASLVWTIVGSLQQMPQIYYLPSATNLVIGYYFLLAVPMLLVVPMAAYRSLEGEVDDGTLELLSITSLSPLQIVWGKLSSAALQMLLYFIVLVPCLAYAYTLRGVELSTLVTLLVGLMLAGLFLTSLALALSPVSPGRMGQSVLMLIMLAILLVAEYWLAQLAVSLIRFNPIGDLSVRQYAALLLAVVLLLVSLGWLFLVAAAAKLTPISENRSTAIRISAWGHTMVVMLIAATYYFYSQSLGKIETGIIAVTMAAIYLILFWIPTGAMMSSESSVLTARVRRGLPATFVGRALGTWLTPGPATGLTFATAVLVSAIAGLYLLLIWGSGNYTPQQSDTVETLATLATFSVSYIILAWVGARMIMAFLSRGAMVKVQVGLAAASLTALLMVLVPYGTELVLRDYRQLSYSLWQSTNWVWTLAEAADRQTDTLTLTVVASYALIAFLLHLLLLGRRVLPQRLVTPERVLAEYRRLSGIVVDDPAARSVVDPLAADDPLATVDPPAAAETLAR